MTIGRLESLRFVAAPCANSMSTRCFKAECRSFGGVRSYSLSFAAAFHPGSHVSCEVNLALDFSTSLLGANATTPETVAGLGGVACSAAKSWVREDCQPRGSQSAKFSVTPAFEPPVCFTVLSLKLSRGRAALLTTSLLECAALSAVTIA